MKKKKETIPTTTTTTNQQNYKYKNKRKRKKMDKLLENKFLLASAGGVSCWLSIKDDWKRYEKE